LQPWVDNCQIYGRGDNDIFIYSTYTGCSLYGETGASDKIDYSAYTGGPTLVYLNTSTATLGSKTEYLYTIEYVKSTN
jgi:hypothetical protein